MDLLHAMRIFVSVADQGSMAAAARALDLAPPIVTRHVAQLETHLGARLLQRNSRRLSLTDIGREYSEKARSILAKVDDANDLVSRISRTPVGRLRLAAPSVLLSSAVAPLLPAFTQRYPDIQLSLSAHSQLRTPDEHADLSLLVAPVGSLQGEFVARLLAHTEIVLCASPEYLRKHGHPQHPSDLADHELLVPKSMQGALMPCLNFEHRSGGPSVQVQRPLQPSPLDTEHRETLYDAVKAGMGVGGMPSFAAVADLKSGRVLRVLPDWRAGDFAVHAAVTTRQHQPARVRLAIDFFVEAFGGAAHDPWLQALAKPPPSSSEQQMLTPA